MSYQQKYSELCIGHYGLVDITHRGIWLTLENEVIAHQIKKTFNSKLTLLVADLSTFVNYTENLIDSNVCLSWTLPYTEKIMLATHSLNNETFNKTQTDYNTSDSLINEPPNLLLNNDQRLELQDQIFLYKKIIQESTIISTNRFYNKELVDSFFEKLDQIFLTEITLDEIEKQLYKLLEQYITELPLLAMYMAIIDKIYE